MADTSTNIKVKGRVELRPSTKCYYWHIVLTWYEGKTRRRESVATKFTETHNDATRKKTRNKGRAETFCTEVVKNKELLLNNNTLDIGGSMLFSDFMEHEWLPIIEKTVSERTFSGYTTNVKSSIAPYFKAKGI